MLLLFTGVQFTPESIFISVDVVRSKVETFWSYQVEPFKQGEKFQFGFFGSKPVRIGIEPILLMAMNQEGQVAVQFSEVSVKYNQSGVGLYFTVYHTGRLVPFCLISGKLSVYGLLMKTEQST